MNLVISVFSPKAEEKQTKIINELGLSLGIKLYGFGTAVQSMLDILGIESTEKRVFLTVAGIDDTKKLIALQKERLFLGVPGHGVTVAVPIKSIGGGKTVAFLNREKTDAKFIPDFSCGYELIVAVANEGRSDLVMNAARSAGATGGTVIHGKGTGNSETARFYNVSIAEEKDVILIVAKTEQKAEIMRAVLEKAGPQTEAGTITFSLPVSCVAGFGMNQGE